MELVLRSQSFCIWGKIIEEGILGKKITGITPVVFLSAEVVSQFNCRLPTLKFAN